MIIRRIILQINSKKHIVQEFIRSIDSTNLNSKDQTCRQKACLLKEQEKT